MIKKIFLIFTTIIIYSCSSTKQIDNTIIYADTEGLSFLFKMINKKKGILFIDNNKDSIAFHYELKKVSQKLINSKTKKENKTVVYEYHIQYPDSKRKEYEILKKYDTLISLEKKSIFRYEPHTK